MSQPQSSTPTASSSTLVPHPTTVPSQNATTSTSIPIVPDLPKSEPPDSDTQSSSSKEIKEADLPSAPKGKKELEIQDQSTRMPLRKLFKIYFGIGIALMLSFIDQTGVSTAAPVIGTALGGSSSITWVGTSFFVANCAMHLVYGRLSDIFGRKTMLQVAVFFLAFGNLLCGFAKTPVQLYIFRAISGMGGGGVNGIAMTIVSDIVPLKDRGKYQGLISAACTGGSAIGPFIGGGLASSGHWRWLFWITTIFGTLCIIMDHFVLPLKPVHGDIRTKLKQIDYLGIFLSAAGTVLLLVPISGGGSTFAWDSAAVIGLLVSGGVCMIGFFLTQWKFAALPILPLRLFNDKTVTVVMIQSFFIGMIYYGNIFYVPIYLQYVKGYSSLVSGAWILVTTLPNTVWGIWSGFYISRTNHYKRIIVIGALLWTLGLGLQILWKESTHIAVVLVILLINGFGVGWSLQTTMVAALATTPAPDRAVVTAARNFFRTMGGAFGLAISNAIYNNIVSSNLPSWLSPSDREAVISSALDGLKRLNDSQQTAVKATFMKGLRTDFIFFTAVAAICIVLSFMVDEVTFRKDSPALVAEKERYKREMAAKAEAGQAGLIDTAVEPIHKHVHGPGHVHGHRDADEVGIEKEEVLPGEEIVDLAGGDIVDDASSHESSFTDVDEKEGLEEDLKEKKHR